LDSIDNPNLVVLSGRSGNDKPNIAEAQDDVVSG
jgi:hypothetical protein